MSEKLTRGVGEMINRETVKRIALERGFTLREQQGSGRIDLNEYVYDFAAELAAELTKGSEPVAWAATSEEGVVEALGFNQSKRFDTPLYISPQPATPPVWQPIETAPKDGLLVLLCTDGGIVFVGKLNKHLQLWVDDEGRERFRTVKHWMPIPIAPEPGK